MAIVVTCRCGKQFKVKEELAGKRGKCAACGRVLSIPTLPPSVDQEKAAPSPVQTCPTCGEALQPNAVICLNCGLDMRTGKQLPHSHSSAAAAPSGPSANAPASSARLWIALIAVGTCLAGVAAAVILLFSGRGPAIAPQVNSGTPNASPLAKAPPGPIAPSRSPNAAVPVANNEGPDSKNTKRPPAGVVLLSSKFVDAVSIRLRIDPFGPEENLRIGVEPGRRLLWTEFKLTRPGQTTIDLSNLRTRDGAGGQYPPTGFKVGLTRDDPDHPQVSQIIRSAGLKAPVLPNFTGGSSSTEYATLRIDASPNTITVNIKRGEAVISFVFVVPANVTDLTIGDIAGGDVALGTPRGG